MTIYTFLLLVLVGFFIWMIYMPGQSYPGPLPALNDAGRNLASRLEAHVNALCSNPAGRDFIEKEGLLSARKYIAGQFAASGYEVVFHEYQLTGDTVANIEVTHAGASKPDEIILVGAHYDAVHGAPGANDNGSGVAAMLELADRFRDKNFSRTLRLVAFVNEEPPNFMTATMGSNVYAKQVASKKENIIAMFALETIGYFSDAVGSQHYPPPLNLFYPDRGNFIAFVGNLRSRGLVTRSLRSFRAHAMFPSEGIAAPGFIPGISWSDHWSFWRQGYPAIMITDTAPYRYPYYHTPDDTPDKVNYEKMAHVVDGLEKMLEEFLH